MLMSRPRTTLSSLEMADVHNYYERLVTEAVLTSHSRAAKDTDFLADVSCVALNHLPPRYIRHDVDMSFFMSPVEREETSNKVQLAVNYALQFVLEHEQAKIELQTKETENNSPDTVAPEPTEAAPSGGMATETVEHTVDDSGNHNIDPTNLSQPISENGSIVTGTTDNHSAH